MKYTMTIYRDGERLNNFDGEGLQAQKEMLKVFLAKEKKLVDKMQVTFYANNDIKILQYFNRDFGKYKYEYLFTDVNI